MKKRIEIIKAVVSMALLIMPSTLSLQAGGVLDANEYTSVYLHNALENKVQFRDFSSGYFGNLY